jgi:hypothetical protein
MVDSVRISELSVMPPSTPRKSRVHFSFESPRRYTALPQNPEIFCVVNDSQSRVTENVAKSPAGPGTKKDFAGECQERFAWIEPRNREISKYTRVVAE